MKNCVIQSVLAVDARFALTDGAGTDSVHTRPEYCMAVTRLACDGQISGTGIALTLGDGNRLVCEAIDLLAKPLAGMEINELMSNFGTFSRRLADDPSLRWLGPHNVTELREGRGIPRLCREACRWSRSACHAR
jgi:L-fuconate dehydratase